MSRPFKYKDILTIKFLTEQYLKNKKSLGKILQETNINKTTILEYLKMNNIKTRTKSNGLKGIKNPKVSEANKKRIGKKATNYKDGRTLRTYYCIDCGKELSCYKAKRCRNCSQKGKDAPMYGRRGKEAPRFGKISHGKSSYYKGIWMRSSWEVLFAQFLSLSGIKWIYEPKAFGLGNTTYRPDFYIPEFDCYIEIKGYWREDAKVKFNTFRKYYPKANIKLLMEKELIDLGVLK